MKPLVIVGCIVLIVAFIVFLLWTPDRDRASLEALYLRSPADIIEVAGTRLDVRDSGPKDAPAVILLHGFGSSLHTWEAWAGPLSSDHRVIRFDLPGCGLSPPDPTGDYSDARSIAVMLALMDRLGVAKASVVGNSMGGRIAWTFASEHPERVDKLVLISPDGFESPGFEYGRKPDVPATVKLMRYVLPKPLVKMSLAPAYADPKVMTDELATRYYDLMRAPGVRDAMIARMEQSIRFDPVPRLQAIRAPTLLLWGEQDKMIPFTNAADYVKSIPGAKLEPLPGVGHLPQEEVPERSLAAVRAFLH
ncbi:MAG: alpha/beta hydrolase [Burkholderiaceae bacterium]